MDLGGFMGRRIGEMKSELTQATGGGGRFPCQAVLFRKTYANSSLDVGEHILEFPEIGFAPVLASPKAQQFAEKVHAYTCLREGRRNTRTKDLVALVLLAERGLANTEAIRLELAVNFTHGPGHAWLAQANPHRYKQA